MRSPIEYNFTDLFFKFSKIGQCAGKARHGSLKYSPAINPNVPLNSASQMLKKVTLIVLFFFYEIYNSKLAYPPFPLSENI